MSALAQKHAGRRAFFIGNGPSINRQNLDLLAGEVTFACNSFFLKYPEIGFRPTYHVVEDRLVAEDNAEELSRLSCSEKLIPWDLKHWIRPDDKTTYLDFRRHYLASEDPRYPRFSFNVAEQAYWGGTVLYLSIQLAVHMGCNPLYLIGVDMNYTIPKDVLHDGARLTSTTDDSNHFHPAYFGAGKRWHQPNMERMAKCFHRAWEAVDGRGLQLWNATDGGNLNTVPRKDFASLFPKA